MGSSDVVWGFSRIGKKSVVCRIINGGRLGASPVVFPLRGEPATFHLAEPLILHVTQPRPSPLPLRILVTAGPTHEPVDAVRYIANRSSGRMGVALADAALRRGHSVTLLLGPTAVVIPAHSRLTPIRFQTVADLQTLLRQHWPSHDLLIMAAAVADFRPVPPAAPQQKLPRTSAGLTLTLEPTPDLLAEMATLATAGQTTIGFALESPDHLESRALEKLQRKGIDAIVANPIETMDSDSIRGILLSRHGTVKPPQDILDKVAFAQWLILQAEELHRAKTG